jgi:hypothetical protein
LKIGFAAPVAIAFSNDVFNIAIRALRANTSEWDVVDHGLAFLANMREVHKGAFVDDDYDLLLFFLGD